jgi:predicted ArsR family transcriptional regulator
MDEILQKLIESNIPKEGLGKKIYDCLEEKGPMPRSEFVKILQVPRTTIYDVLKKLIDQNVVCKQPLVIGKRGRPKVFFSLITQIVAS